MRTTIHIDDHLFRDVKKVAAETGSTFTALVESALRQALAARNASSSTPAIELPTLDLGGTRPGVDLDNSAALLDLMERSDDSV
jgi:hypothetical protein